MRNILLIIQTDFSKKLFDIQLNLLKLTKQINSIPRLKFRLIVRFWTKQEHNVMGKLMMSCWSLRVRKYKYFSKIMGNLFHQDEGEQVQKERSFRLNEVNTDLGNNEITSTNYTVLTFIPLNILNQFSNLPNMYFLLICILQMVPSISVTGGKPTTLLPLSFVILTVLIKDAYEEFLRYRKDNEENKRPTTILRPNGAFQADVWENITCGQILKIKQNQLIPCDSVILSSNLPDGKCFIETRSLDGETNLKSRKAPQFKIPLHKMKPSQLAQKRYEIHCEAPNPSLHNIRGSINVEGQLVSISNENALLRGCNLRNCKEVICAALYVGSDTKVMKNGAKFSAKKSKLMAEIDKMVLSIFIAQIILSMVMALFNILIENSQPKFIQIIGSTRFWINVASWWLLMTYFVPISLIVTMEMIKLFQGSILEKDKRGYSQQYKCFISANNTSINQNLGQIKYVFTDKTGTLTKNQMNFKKLVVNGTIFGEREDISDQQLKKSFPKTNNVRFKDSNFFKNTNDQKIKDYLRVLYLCHDIIVNKEQSGGYSYNSSSPDEIALINFAKMCGYELIEEEGTFTKIYDRQSKSVVKFEKLAFLDFSSDRKRMSIIARMPNGQIELLMKGADSIVQKRLSPGQPTLQQTKEYLQKFSIEGLRTLMLARRTIPEAEFNQWYRQYMQAKSSIQGRQKKLEATYEIIEKNLELVGGTAVEDRLQDEVSETIVMMKQAGIKFFILTGDKKQTAVTIGRACGLISPVAKVFSYPEQKMEGQAYKNEKVYLLDASEEIQEYPIDVYTSQVICYRCTPIQKKNIVEYIKAHSPEYLTLAIGDGANDVNMILAADVGVGVKGHEGTEATRVADISVGQYKYLAFITLYYGREWYRKNASLVSYNFFKNWYHVACVITYGAYSYFSAVVIFDIYNYQLFNALYAALPIVIYAIFDEEYDWDQSKKYHDIYHPGLTNAYFNTMVYFKNIGQGIIYGVLSILIVFMVLEDNILTKDGRTGYMWQSGAVLFFNIIMVVNFKVLVMSHKISVGLLVSVFGSIGLYWFVYFVEAKTFSDFKLKDSIWQQWSTMPIYLIHIILLFILLMIEYAYRKFKRFEDNHTRMLSKYSFHKLVNDALGLGILKE